MNIGIDLDDVLIDVHVIQSVIDDYYDLGVFRFLCSPVYFILKKDNRDRYENEKKYSEK